MEYTFEFFAGQIIVMSEDNRSGFYVVNGQVTCTRSGEVCFSNYLQAPSQAEVDIVKNATLAEGTTEEIRKVALAKMSVRIASQKNAA